MSKTYDRSAPLEDNQATCDTYAKMIGSQATDLEVMNALKQKHGNAEQAAESFGKYKDCRSFIEKKAHKFKNLIFTKYSTLALTPLLEKARKYSKKYGLSQDVFNAFIQLALNDENYASINKYNQPNTPMSKALGYFNDINTGKMNVPANELDVVQEILRLHSDNSILQEHVKVQSLTYRDCALQALKGKYDYSKNNPYSFIHPVIAALFLPRIKYIDEQMLLSSIANIIYCRFHGVPIKLQQEYKLYWDLITDPNEIGCVTARESALADIRNRVRLQIELWKCVRDLREGRYYNSSAIEFIAAVDSCRNGFFDSPDMTHVRDEGTVLRRLLGAFSIRPTVVSIMSIYQPNQIMTGNYSIGSMNVGQVLTIPIVNFRLPFNLRGTGHVVDLKDSIGQPDWFVENKMIVPKLKSIVFSNDLIIFYTNRRFQSVNYGSFNSPCNFSRLPATTSAFENINDTNVDCPAILPIGSDVYNIRSVVTVDRALTNPDLIVGCSTAIKVMPDGGFNGYQNSFYICYDPQGANAMFIENGELTKNDPIYTIPENANESGVKIADDFETRCRTRGTIYVYVKDTPQYTNIKVQ